VYLKMFSTINQTFGECKASLFAYDIILMFTELLLRTGRICGRLWILLSNHITPDEVSETRLYNILRGDLKFGRATSRNRIVVQLG
jgi:hypothetical protein